jgi:uncharacterized protein (TIGR00255 family)
MTGFGRATHESPKLRVDVEIRSVNHRFLKVNVKTAREVESLSPAIEEAVRRRVARGAVDVLVRLERKDDAAAWAFDETALMHHVAALEKARKKLKLAGSPDLALAASLPGVFRQTNSVEPDPRESARIFATVEKALDAFSKSRLAEGRRLAKELDSRRRAIEKLVATVAERAPQVVAEHHEKLLARVQKLLAGSSVTVKPEDLAREIAVIADRSDVTEEVARLRSHSSQFAAVLRKTGGDVGRELDFLVQEMFREANTTGSKSADVAVSHAVVAIKVEIEKLREQVQNVE